MIPSPLCQNVLERWRDFVTWKSDEGFPLSRLLQPEVQSLLNYIDGLQAEVDSLQAERDKVASGKVTCADCNAILARW
jgi:hypothetical protein